MQEAYIRSNPLIRSVIHKSLHNAIKEIGLPEFPQQVLMTEVSPYLRIPDSVFDDDEASREKVAKSIFHGEVIATEVRNDEVLVFYVRGGRGGKVIDVRLTCRKHEWQIESVISMYTRPITRSPWFYRASVAGAVVVAALVGYAVHTPTGDISQPVAQQTATPVNTGTVATPPATSPATPTATSPTPKPKVNHPTTDTVRFTLTRGMPLYNLAQFLQVHHLVSNAMSFDMLMKKTKVDRNIKPGTYTFKTGMSEHQLIQVLQHGPSNS